MTESGRGDLYVDLTDYPVDPEVVRLLPPKLARRYMAIPLAHDGERIVVALADPTDLVAVDDIRTVLNSRIRALAATPESLAWALNNWLNDDAEAADLVRMAEEEAPDTVAEVTTATQASEAPIIRLVDVMLSEAVQAEASDIHLEPTRGALLIRHRIDGVLREVRRLPRSVAPALLSRIKLLAGMNIAERRVPQDGRIRTRLLGETLDMRVAALPTVHGENITIRILHSGRAAVGLDEVGFSEAVLPRYAELVRRPHGAVLVTGPTGSGKSTTLHATLASAHDPGKKIFTVEDPIEFEVAGISQTQVNNTAGMTFARALRAILRSDPDVILVGEIRDRETAVIALEAALTGHLVLSTLHTNDAASTPLRLIELGVDPYLVASSLEGVVAQRLVRRLCTDCRAPLWLQGNARLPAEVTPAGTESGKANAFRAVGCAKCGDSGYRGRIGIQELMVVSSRIEKLVADGAGPETIREVALEEGMVPLREAGEDLVSRGITTMEEIMRVTI